MMNVRFCLFHMFWWIDTVVIKKIFLLNERQVVNIPCPVEVIIMQILCCLTLGL